MDLVDKYLSEKKKDKKDLQKSLKKSVKWMDKTYGKSKAGKKLKDFKL